MNQQERKQPGQQRKEQQQKQQQPHQDRKRGQKQQQQIQRTKPSARGTKDKPPKISKKADLQQKKKCGDRGRKSSGCGFFQGTSVKYFSKFALTIAKCSSAESTFRAN